MDDYRETIWGIRPDDRKWFESFTLVGGIAGSILLTVMELNSVAVGTTQAETARNIVLGIGGSFVASGFIVWGLLQVKDYMSSLGNWIRDKTKERRERWMKEAREKGIEQGIEQGRRQGREETLREIYGPDYVDPQGDKSAPSDDADNLNGKNGDVRAR